MNRLAQYLLALIALFVFAGILATWRGALWPFDLRVTLLMTLSGLAGLVQGWGAVWLLPVALSLVLPETRTKWRLLLWGLALMAMVALHGTAGPRLGFAPLALPDALLLYAVPVALAIWLGAALRQGIAFLARLTGIKS